MTWMLIIGLLWVSLGCLLAVVVGRAIRLADARTAPSWTGGVARLRRQQREPAAS